MRSASILKKSTQDFWSCVTRQDGVYLPSSLLTAQTGGTTKDGVYEQSRNTRAYDHRRIEPLVPPLCYRRMHCFPNAGELFNGQTPRLSVFL